MTQTPPSLPARRTIVSGDAATLARRYVDAILELADAQNQADAVAVDLCALGVLARENAEFRKLARHPRLTIAQVSTALRALAKVAEFQKLTVNFLLLIARNRRLDLMETISETFAATLATRRGEHIADVRTAHALTPEQREQLGAKLSALAGGTVHLDIREDAGLLGGLTVKLGARLFDLSIKSKLQRLERVLNSAA